MLRMMWLLLFLEVCVRILGVSFGSSVVSVIFVL